MVSGIVGLKFMDLRDNASRFQYSRKMSDVFELSVVNQYKQMVLIHFNITFFILFNYFNFFG